MRGEILRFAENRFVVVETTVIRIENIPALAHLCPGMHRVYCHPEAAAEGSGAVRAFHWRDGLISYAPPTPDSSLRSG